MSAHDQLPIPDLGLTGAEADTRFAQLQAKLVPLWKSLRAFNQDEQTIVLVTSMLSGATWAGAIQQAFEERFLFLLLLLRTPGRRA
jgi:hypothetical protein